MKIRPLGDRILVKRIKEEEKTKGGIIIPDTAKEKPQEGKVVAVGKGKVTEEGKLIAPDVKAGDRILFGKYSGSEVKLEAKSISSCARTIFSACSRADRDQDRKSIRKSIRKILSWDCEISENKERLTAMAAKIVLFSQDA